MAATQVNGHAAEPKLTLYTNHECPYAHRAHITLEELGLPYEEVIIDLAKPREPWYLKVNPRGLVPSLRVSGAGGNDTIITESQVVAQYLADSHPSGLCPSSTDSQAPLFRARLNFFMDTWNNKISSHVIPAMKEADNNERVKKCEEWVAAIEKEIEPLLHDASPFFAGSKDLTLAEVHTGPFLLRIYLWCNDELLPASMKASLEKLPSFSKWAKAVRENKNVLSIWNEPEILRKNTTRILAMREQNK